MQHHPHVVFCVQAKLDKMVAATKAAALEPRPVVERCRTFGIPLQSIKAVELAPRLPLGSGVADISIAGEAHRNFGFDSRANLANLGHDLFGRHKQFKGPHPTTDIDPHGRRNHRAFGRHNGADRGADAEVYVRHGCNVLKHERHGRYVFQLIQSLGLDLVEL